ncbi:MAG TPA: hypothetical protein VH741_04050, partial [Candidatus Limnocylindrales bacterium]
MGARTDAAAGLAHLIQRGEGVIQPAQVAQCGGDPHTTERCGGVPAQALAVRQRLAQPRQRLVQPAHAPARLGPHKQARRDIVQRADRAEERQARIGGPHNLGEPAARQVRARDIAQARVLREAIALLAVDIERPREIPNNLVGRAFLPQASKADLYEALGPVGAAIERLVQLQGLLQPPPGLVVLVAAEADEAGLVAHFGAVDQALAAVGKLHGPLDGFL